MYLPLTVLVFCIVPQLYRCFVLLVASLFFLAMSSPLGVVIMLVSLLIDFFLSRPIFLHAKNDRRSKLTLYFAAIKNILLVVAVSVTGQIGGLVVSLGVSIYAFTSLGYLIDLYNGEADPITSVYEYLVFCGFFGKLHIGPLVSSRDFCPQLRNLKPSLASMSDGCIWFCHGLAKRVILADNIRLMGDQLRAIPYNDKTVGGVWLLVICYLFATYFTLSGYSDMARGLGAFFGLTLPENFHYPLQSVSVTDFFSNFNISANRYVRKYVYGALGAEDNGTVATAINILLITMLMGLWYGISLNFLVWGSILGCFIIFETLAGDRLLSIPAFIRRTGTLALLVVSFAIFSSGNLSQSWFYLRSMFGLEGQLLYDSRLLYFLTSNLVLLVLCTVFSTSFFSRRARMLQNRYPTISGACSLVGNLIILAVSMSFII